MTKRADRLTKRAKTPGSAGSIRSSYPASSARVFIDALERLNYSVQSLLANAGIRRADLDDPDARIPCAVWGPMFRQALEQRPMKNPGMRAKAWNGSRSGETQIAHQTREPLANVLRRHDQVVNQRESPDRRHGRQPPPMEGVALEVHRALVSRVGRGDTRIKTIARILATSPRSLQRRLASAGVSYQRLLDLSRKDAAERYLTDSPLSICEVAYLLGYSEPAAFHRAFRRWHHATPQAFRATAQFRSSRQSRR